MHRIAAGAPPFLITYCQNDYPSLPAEARNFYAALQAAKVPSQLVYIPDKNHISEIVDIWQENDLTARSILQFIATHQ
jgi:acetyl esterase/lipase